MKKNYFFLTTLILFLLSINIVISKDYVMFKRNNGDILIKSMKFNENKIDKLSEIKLDNTKKNNILIYPNPCSNYFNLSLTTNISNPKLIISDIKGNVFLSFLLDNLNSRIDLDNKKINNGTYILNIIENNTIIYTKTLIKKN